MKKLRLSGVDKVNLADQRAVKGNDNAPKLSRRHLNKRSTIKSGRTIGERREHLETANERLAARKKVKKRQNLRILWTVIGFIALFLIVIFLVVYFIKQREQNESDTATTAVVKTYAPTIEIIDHNSNTITARMSEYIGQLESDLKNLNLMPLKAVIPNGAIREVDFYLDGHNGYIKTTIDRGAGVTAEDIDRMLRYLSSIGVNDFEYIDVRIDGKAFWK